MVSNCPHLIGLTVPLVQLYTGMAGPGWVAWRHAAAMARLMGMSTGTKSAILSLLTIWFGLVTLGWVRQLLTCSKLFLRHLSQLRLWFLLDHSSSPATLATAPSKLPRQCSAGLSLLGDGRLCSTGQFLLRPGIVKILSSEQVKINATLISSFDVFQCILNCHRFLPLFKIKRVWTILSSKK